MLGAFAGTWIFVAFEAQPWQVAAATIVGTVLVGMYVERLCFWAIRKDAAVASMVSSFVIWMQLEEVATILLPGRTYPFPELFSAGGLEVGPYFLRMEHVTTLAVVAIVLVLLRLLLFRTTFGLALRAVSEEPGGGGLHGHQAEPRHLSRLHACIPDRWRRRIPVARLGSAGYAVFRPLGNVQGVDRHDAGRNGVVPWPPWSADFFSA